MYSYDEMMNYCLHAGNVNPGLDMCPDADAPCGPGPSVDIMNHEDPVPSSTCTLEKVPSHGGSTSLTDLPFEIRLQIYHWLHLMSPVRHAQLAPWYPTPVHCQYILRIVEPDDAHSDSGSCSSSSSSSGSSSGSCSGSNSSSSESSSEESSKPARSKKQKRCLPSPGLLSPYRPLSGLPTSLLQCNSQIYREARSLPFARNEFVFVNWFASGLWAARAFTRALELWQRNDLCFVRLEILARDLVGGGAGLEEWLALCEDWAFGVRGLRMKMVLGGTGTGVMAWGAAGAAAQALDRQDAGQSGEIAAEARARVVDGLSTMLKLERVEMEIVSRLMKDHDKIEWCTKLEEELGSSGLRGVRVICVEKVKEKMEWIRKDVAIKHLQGLTEY